MTADAILALFAAVATIPLARTAYRCGWRHAAPRLPAALVDDLRTHKLVCLGEPEERVRLELSLLLGVDPDGACDRNRHRETATSRGTPGVRG